LNVGDYSLDYRPRLLFFKEQAKPFIPFDKHFAGIS
jgi:hypothetical protein